MPSAKHARGISELVDAIWRSFASVKLALVLILLITVASLFGMFLAQAPAGVAGNPVAYKQWVELIRPKYGGWTDILSRLQLLMVFQTAWFKLLLGLLGLNILVCIASRLRTVWASTTRIPRVILPEDAFKRARLGASFEAQSSSLDQVTDQVRCVLKAQRFRIRAEQQSGVVSFYADRNNWSHLGTVAHHLGIVLLLGAVVYGGRGGFTESSFMVPMGSERAIGHGTDLSIRLDSFADEYYASGPPKDYRSEVTLVENGTDVKQQTVRVNSPLVYRGIRIHQAFFGSAVVMKVTDASGKTLFQDGVPLGWRIAGRPAGSFTLKDQGLDVYVVAPSSEFLDTAIQAGQVRLEVYREGTRDQPLQMGNADMGSPVKLGSLSYTFVEETRFSGFQVVHNPGLSFVWIACAAIVVGLIVVLYFPHRRLWLMCRRSESGDVTVRAMAAPDRAKAFERSFKGLVADLERAVKGRREPARD